ncbi:MAG: glycosyltransferase family 4 protein [Actinomycetales bacterium]
MDESTLRGHQVSLRVPGFSELARRRPDLVVPFSGRADLLIANDFRSLWRNASRAKRRVFICHGWWQVSRARRGICHCLRAPAFPISRSVRDAMIDHGWRPPDVLPIGPNPQRFRPPTLEESITCRNKFALSHERPVLAWVGRFQDVKRPEMFIALVRKLDFQGLMIVPPGVKSSQEREIQRMILDSAGSHLTVIPGGTALEAYWASDAFVSTSRFESLGMAMLEAQSCGLPVITTATGGPIDFVRPPGVILDSDADVATLAGAVVSALNEGGLPCSPSNLSERSPAAALDAILAAI